MIKFSSNGQWTLIKSKPRYIIKDSDLDYPTDKDGKHRFRISPNGDAKRKKVTDPQNPHQVYERHPTLGHLSYTDDGKGNKSDIANSYKVFLNDEKQTQIAHIDITHKPDLFGNTLNGGTDFEEDDPRSDEVMDAVSNHHTNIMKRPTPSKEDIDRQRSKYFTPTGETPEERTERAKQNLKNKAIEDFEDN